MGHEFSYGFGRGQNQAAYDAIEAKISRESFLVPGSPARVFRLTSNALMDLYRNGWGESHVFLPTFMQEFTSALQKAVWEDLTEDEDRAFRAIDRFYHLQMTAYNTAYGDENEYLDEPVAQDDVEWPNADGLFDPMECIMDYVVRNVGRCINPLEPMKCSEAVA